LKIPKQATDDEWQQVGIKKEKKDQIYNQAPSKNSMQNN